MNIKRLNSENFISNLRLEKRPWQDDYLAMYSSRWNGFVTDPDLMMLPIDDHLVHRGDGVFDVMRCVNGKIYQMEAHLRRLERSARAIFLDFPKEYDNIREIIKILILKGGEKECLIRVTLSRGPGGFSTNPSECPLSQIYISIVRYNPLPEMHYKEGIRVISSSIPIKKSYFATIKSCNYLQNVLMKREAIKAGCQYSIGRDDEGFLAEGSAENVGVVSGDGVLKFPSFAKTLAGITVSRIYELADILVREKLIERVEFTGISEDVVYRASEVMLMGTSINLLPVTIFDGRRVGEGIPGPVYWRLSRLLWKDMTENQDLLTSIEW